MVNLVIGAAASGKSEYAEDIVMSLPGEKIYIATMEPFGAEAEERIARHRALRAGKGFSTVERPRNLINLTPEADWNVLIEDLPNLAANELFSPEGGGADAVLSGVEMICKTASNVTIVTGDIFSDGAEYDVGTREYMEMLADLHMRIAAKADNVVEVVCGIPCAVKGELPVNIVNYETAEVQELLREKPNMDVAALAEKLSGYQAITQTEVGAGVIPLSASDREWRERAGRLACLLASRADIVVRMVCGVPIIVKNLRL